MPSSSPEFSLIEELLQARGYLEWRGRLAAQAINRRQFLAGAAAGTAATLVSSQSFGAELPVVIRDDHTGVVTVTFKGLTWSIDPRRFAESEGKKPRTAARELPTRDVERPR